MKNKDKKIINYNFTTLGRLNLNTNRFYWLAIEKN